MQSSPAQCSPTQYVPSHCAPMQCPPMERVESHPHLPPHIQHQYRTASPLQLRRTVSGSLSYPESFPPPPSPVVGGHQHHPSKSHSYHENMVRHIDECGVPVFVPVDSGGRLRYQDAVHRPAEPIPVYHKPPMSPALMQHHLAHRKKLQEACGDNFPGRPLSSMSASNYPAFQRVHPDPYHSQPTSPTGYNTAHSAKLETLQEGHSGSYSNHTASVIVSSSKAFSTVTQSYSTETLKHRAKDWVETSLDSPLPARKPPKQQEPPPASPSHASVLSSGSESLPEAFQGPGVMLSRHNSCREGRVAVESPQPERDKICSPVPQPSPKAMPGVELNIVTVGHFQPYWEETKPYEISDFYKYSTKHRKPSGGQDSTRSPSQSGNSSGLVSPVLMSPVAADNVSRERDEQLHAHSSLAEHMKMVERSPPDGMAAVEEPHSGRSADSSLNLDRSSVADAFHEEMIAWYEDQDSGNKATLV
uniref:Cuticular protein 21 n=1 Tax=Rhipicephalus appendiculatus TaxID=34631 RepID=A0A131YYW2_RHIAP